MNPVFLIVLHYATMNLGLLLTFFQKVDPYDRPWAGEDKPVKASSTGIAVPFKGKNSNNVTECTAINVLL